MRLAQRARTGLCRLHSAALTSLTPSFKLVTALLRMASLFSSRGGNVSFDRGSPQRDRVLGMAQAQMEDRRASHLRSSPSCFHRTSMSWIICKVSMSCRRSVRPAQWGERTCFRWVLQPQPRPCPCVPRLCLSSAHPPGAAVPRAPPPRAIQHDGGKGSQGPSGPSLGPSLGPGWLTVPVLKDDAHAAVTACLLVAVHDPQRLHLGVHERALLHAAGRTAVRGRASARPGGRGALAGGGPGGSPDFSQQDAGVKRGLQVGKGLQVGLLAHAQVHQLLGLGLRGLLGAHLDDVVQGLQLAQRFPLVGRMGGQCGQAGRGRLRASGQPLGVLPGPEAEPCASPASSAPSCGGCCPCSRPP